MTIPIKIISKEEYDRKYEKPSQEKIWDSIAGIWEEYRGKPVPIVEEFLKDKKGVVIDLGCGSGRNMIFNKDISYYGVDFSSSQLKYAEEYIKLNKTNAKLFKSKIDKLDKSIFKNNMFDYGLFIATLHCLEFPKERLNSLKEFYRVLKPDAEALVSVWNSEDKRFDDVENHGDIYMSWKKDGIFYMRYYYLFEKNELLKLIESVGFKILEFYSPKEHYDKLMTLSSRDRFSRKNWVVRVEKP